MLHCYMDDLMPQYCVCMTYNLMLIILAKNICFIKNK